MYDIANSLNSPENKSMILLMHGQPKRCDIIIPLSMYNQTTDKDAGIDSIGKPPDVMNIHEEIFFSTRGSFC